MTKRLQKNDGCVIKDDRGRIAPDAVVCQMEDRISSCLPPSATTSAATAETVAGTPTWRLEPAG